MEARAGPRAEEGNVMDSLLRSIACESCGTRHHFCLPAGAIATGQRYAYLCPVSGQKTQLCSDSDGEPIPHAPYGAVQLTPTEEGPRRAVTAQV